MAQVKIKVPAQTVYLDTEEWANTFYKPEYFKVVDGHETSEINEKIVEKDMIRYFRPKRGTDVFEANKIARMKGEAQAHYHIFENLMTYGIKAVREKAYDI